MCTTHSVHDSAVAEQSIRTLAKLTDDEQARDIRAAADAVTGAFDAWRKDPAWRRDQLTGRLVSAVERVRQALAELPDGAPLRAVVDVVAPLLGLWWPGHPEPAVRVDEAIDHLRHLAMRRPHFVNSCRSLVASGLAEESR